MSLTDDAKRLFEWAEKQQNSELTDKIFSKVDVHADSYFEKRDKNRELSYNYDFETFPEIKRQFEKLWEGEEYMKEAAVISAVSVMKYKSVRQNKSDENTVSEILEGEFEIPEYVYIF